MSKMLTTTKTAEILGITTRTLHEWRANGTGPSYVRYSAKTVKYPENELNEWIAARTVKAGA